MQISKNLIRNQTMQIGEQHKINKSVLTIFSMAFDFFCIFYIFRLILN